MVNGFIAWLWVIIALFCKRSEAITIDATVHLCLDISSSMSARMELAREAVLALAYALNQINGVSVSVSAYPGKNDSGVFEVMQPNDRLQDVVIWQEFSGHIFTRHRQAFLHTCTVPGSHSQSAFSDGYKIPQCTQILPA